MLKIIRLSKKSEFSSLKFTYLNILKPADTSTWYFHKILFQHLALNYQSRYDNKNYTCRIVMFLSLPCLCWLRKKRRLAASLGQPNFSFHQTHASPLILQPHLLGLKMLSVLPNNKIGIVITFLGYKLKNWHNNELLGWEMLFIRTHTFKNLSLLVLLIIDPF